MRGTCYFTFHSWMPAENLQGTLSSTRSNQHMHFVQKQYDIGVGGSFLDDVHQALFEFPPVNRAGDQAR